MLKRIISILMSILIIFSISVTAFATSKDRKQHDQNLEMILFKNGKYDKSKKDKVNMIEYASYLAIDQFNYTEKINKKGEDVGNGAKELKYLYSKGVKELPSSVSAIDFKASGNTHRSYTHRGWNWNYSVDKAHWNKRKKILLNTTSNVFGLSSNGKNSKKCDSFCALVFYVHIITDHLQDEWNSKNNKLTNQGLKMPLARAHASEGNEDIFYELNIHLNILFSDQKDSKDFKKLINILNKLAKKSRELEGKKGGINSEKRFNLYQGYADDLLKLLEEYVPRLLLNEKFFVKVFIPSKK